MTFKEYYSSEGITKQAASLRIRRGAITAGKIKPAIKRDHWRHVLVARDAVYTPGRPGRPAKTGK